VPARDKIANSLRTLANLKKEFYDSGNLLLIEAAIGLFGLLSEVSVLLLGGLGKLSLDGLDLCTLCCHCIAE
jgi:hypothetical protein